MSNYNRITFKERVRIEAGIYAKKSFSQIAKEIGRSTSSVTREVKQNRIMVKTPYSCGTDCIYPPSCRKTDLCGDEYCSKRCWTCMDHDCTQYCDRCVTHTCKKTERAPFVCDSCSEKNKKACKYNKYYYLAEKADAKAKADTLIADVKRSAKADEKAAVEEAIKNAQPQVESILSHAEEVCKEVKLSAEKNRQPALEAVIGKVVGINGHS